MKYICMTSLATTMMQAQIRVNPIPSLMTTNMRMMIPSAITVPNPAKILTDAEEEGKTK